MQDATAVPGYFTYWFGRLAETFCRHDWIWVGDALSRDGERSAVVACSRCDASRHVPLSEISDWYNA